MARPVRHEEELPLAEHLDELRSRIVVSLATFGVALALCFWQNHFLLELANGPLPGDREPLTFGVAEPFTTTLTIAAYAAVLLSLPVILYQASAFALPALSARERGAVLPFLVAVPFLFTAGVVFAYLVVVPAATDFLLSFNSTEFRIEIRARDYYGFLGLSLLSVGLLFQVPLATLALTRLGVFTPAQIAANRRYVVLAIAVVAMLLPGTDPITMLISMAPLLLLFEASLALARLIGTPEETEAARSEPLADA